METRLDIANTLAEMPRVVTWTDAFMTEVGDDGDLGGKLHLVVEELVTNVINHGYAAEQTGTIWLTLRTRPGGAVLFVEDAAAPFDPFAHNNAVDTDAALEDREIGGLGLFLVAEMVDHLIYTRHQERNRIAAWFGPEPPDAEPSEDATNTDTSDTGSSLALRFATSFFLVFLISLACATALNFFKFERVFQDTAARQYDSILRDARSAIEGSLGQGLTLASNFSAQVVIDKTVGQHDGAFHLLVQDTQGETLFSDATSAPHAPLPPGLAQRIANEDDGFTRFGNETGLGVAIVIRQGDTSVGMLTLTHNPAEATREVDRLRGVLARIALMIVAIFSPFIALLSYAIMVPVDRRHRRLSSALSRIAPGGTAAAADEYALLHNAQALESDVAGKATL